MLCGKAGSLEENDSYCGKRGRESLKSVMNLDLAKFGPDSSVQLLWRKLKKKKKMELVVV